jgi:hypothetical protein
MVLYFFSVYTKKIGTYLAAAEGSKRQLRSLTYVVHYRSIWNM